MWGDSYAHEVVISIYEIFKHQKVEITLLLKCEIPLLKISIELFPNTFAKEECLLYLVHLDENHRKSSMANENRKKRVKAKYEKSVWTYVFAKYDWVLVYDQDHNKLGVGKLEPLYHGPYIISHVLQKGPTR